MKIAILLQITATFILTGLSWFVQRVHYPLFHWVPQSEFQQFHLEHVSRTNLLIFSLLPIELFTSALAAFYGFPGLSHMQWTIGFVLLLGICLSTILIQIPIHSKLSQEKTEELIHRLVLTHWIRTALWSTRTILLATFIYRRL